MHVLEPRLYRAESTKVIFAWPIWAGAVGAASRRAAAAQNSNRALLALAPVGMHRHPPPLPCPLCCRCPSTSKLDTCWRLHPQMAKLGMALVEARTGAPPPLPPKPAAAAPPPQANGAEPMDTDAAVPSHARAPAAVTDGEAELRVEGEAGPGGATGLGSGAPGEGRARSEGDSVRPQAFKALVGRGHPEFSSSRQQARRASCTDMPANRLACQWLPPYQRLAVFNAVVHTAEGQQPKP